jgi:hypothetical protein
LPSESNGVTLVEKFDVPGGRWIPRCRVVRVAVQVHGQRHMGRGRGRKERRARSERAQHARQLVMGPHGVALEREAARVEQRAVGVEAERQAARVQPPFGPSGLRRAITDFAEDAS